MDKNRWSHGCYRKVVLSIVLSIVLLKLNISWMKIWNTLLSYSKHLLSSRQAAKLFLIYCIKSNFSIFKRQKYHLLTIINDNSNNDEKTNFSKIWVEIFRVGIFREGIWWLGIFQVGVFQAGIWLVGIFRGKFFRGNLMGGNFPVEVFQEEFSWYRLKRRKWGKPSIKNKHTVNSLNIWCRNYWM